VAVLDTRSRSKWLIKEYNATIFFSDPFFHISSYKYFIIYYCTGKNLSDTIVSWETIVQEYVPEVFLKNTPDELETYRVGEIAITHFFKLSLQRPNNLIHLILRVRRSGYFILA